MERCEQTLEEYMERLGRISDHFARLIVNQLAHSIKALHDKGFVHCDIKPSNIMCRMKSHEWLLIDFDSSCRVGEKIMNATPHYSSPEILQAEAAGHRKEIIANGAVDVWAFACVAHEVYTGESLFPNGKENVLKQCRERRGEKTLFDDFHDVSSETVRNLLKEILVEDPKQRPSMAEIVRKLGSVGMTIAIAQAKQEGEHAGLEKGYGKVEQQLTRIVRTQEEITRKMSSLFDEVIDLKTLIVEAPNSDVPRLFMILPAEKPTGKWKSLLHSLKSIKSVQLQLYLICECEWYPHCSGDPYPLAEPTKFFQKTGPILSICCKAFNLLAAFSPLKIPGIPDQIADWFGKLGDSPTEYFDVIKTLVGEAIKSIDNNNNNNAGNNNLNNNNSTGQVATDQMYREFKLLLDALDPNRRYAGLNKRVVKLQSGKENYLWLCKEHIDEYTSKGLLRQTAATISSTRRALPSPLLSQQRGKTD